MCVCVPASRFFLSLSLFCQVHLNEQKKFQFLSIRVGWATLERLAVVVVTYYSY